VLVSGFALSIDNIKLKNLSRRYMMTFTALCSKGPKVGTCPRPPFGQKIVPIFWPDVKNFSFLRDIKKSETIPDKVGYFNYDPEKLLKSQTARPPAEKTFSGKFSFLTSVTRSV
jgi:hypothetical protein